jgi:hypothetical protein
MTTNSIAKILREDPYSKTFFIGVFPRNQLPSIILCCLFCYYTDPSYKEGEDWLGFYFDRNKTCYFFDSFGNRPKILIEVSI